VSVSLFNPCLNHGQGDVINLSGNEHFLFDFSDGVHQKFQTNYQGITGVSQTKGQKYQGTGVTETTFASKVGATFTVTAAGSSVLVGQGTSTNLIVHQNTHVTINPSGTVTVL
jgi:hypothetical protein